MAEIDLESSDPAAIYAAVANADERAFTELMDDPASRERVVEAMVSHMAELFRPEQAGDLEAVIHIKLWDRPGGGYDHYELSIAAGACSMSAPPTSEDPDLTIKVRPGDLRDLVTGDAKAQWLALKGRLRVLGDLRLGMRLPDLFDFDRG